MKVFRLCFYAFFLLSVSSLLNAQTARASAALVSDSLYAVFEAGGFKPEKQLLDNTQSEDFPYNILIPFGTSTQDKKKLIIVIPQQDAENILEELAQFAQNLKNRNLSCQTELLFTANDRNAAFFPLGEKTYPFYEPAGTQTYLNSIETRDNTAAIIVLFQKTEKWQKKTIPLFQNPIELVPGGRSSSGEKHIVPMNIFQTAKKSFAVSQVPFKIRGFFLAMYRLGLIEVPPLISAWLGDDVPTLGFYINKGNSTNGFKALAAFIDEYQYINMTHTDLHYTFIQIFTHTVWVSERIFIIFLISVSALTLFVFWNLSFVRGTHRYIHRKEFFQTWFLIPLIIGSTAAFLFLAQNLLQVLIPENSNLPFFSLFAKILIASLLLALVSAVQYKTKLPITGFIYGYLLSLTSFLNIFLFAAVDIVLIPIFIAEYAIVYFSRAVRRTLPLIACSILMLIPYIPFVVTAAGLSKTLNAEFITHAHFGFNILFACILLPFQIMTIRILVRLKLWGKRRTMTPKKLLLQSAFLTGTGLLLCFIIFAFPRFILFFAKPLPAPKQGLDKNSIQLYYSKDSLIGRNLNKIEISSSAPVIRHSIELSSKAPLPIFESNYPYDVLSKPFTAVFTMDDCPPEPLILNFTTDENQDTLCTVTSWVISNNTVQKKTTSYTIRGSGYD